MSPRVPLRRAGIGAVVVGVLALAVLGLVRAASPAGPPTMRERVDRVAATLRCPTCQGLSIEDSTSVLAAGSRRIIEQQLEQGSTPDEIRQWFVGRYGSSVLLSPDPAGPGLLAWAVPGLAIATGGVLAWRWLRRDVAPADGQDDASSALAAWRDGALDPDDSPAGQTLREALIEAEAGTDAAARARVTAASRRYVARPTAARPSASAPRRPGLALPRRAVTVGAAGVVLVAAGIGVAVGVDQQGSTGSESAAVTPSSPAPATQGAPPPPVGWTGGMPQTPEEWVQLGHTYDAANQPDQAVAAYSMALQLQPDADAVLLLRADVLVRSGHADRALPDLRQLGARHPDTPDVLLVLGLAQNRTGDPGGASTLRRFLELEPDSPAAPGVRSLLDGG